MNSLFRSCLAQQRVATSALRPSGFRIPLRRMAVDAKALRNRMKVVHSIQKITKAMKMVSAAKLTWLQRSLTQVRDFQQPLTDMWKGSEVKGPVGSRALVIITSDRGLCGSMNSSLSRKAKLMLTEANIKRKSSPPYSIFPLGNKGKSALERNFGRYFIWQMNEYAKLKNLQFKQVSLLADRLLAENIDEMHFLYNRFKNLLTSEQKEEKVYGLKTALAHAGPIYSKYEVESGGYSGVLRDLYEFRVAVRLWHMFNENMTTEMSARMNAMSNSSKAAGEMLTKLTLLYNRTRQAKITTELIEIVSGAVAIEQLRSD